MGNELTLYRESEAEFERKYSEGIYSAEQRSKYYKYRISLIDGDTEEGIFNVLPPMMIIENNSPLAEETQKQIKERLLELSGKNELLVLEGKFKGVSISGKVMENTENE